MEKGKVCRYGSRNSDVIPGRSAAEGKGIQHRSRDVVWIPFPALRAAGDDIGDAANAMASDIINAFPQATEADWRARVEAVLKGADFERKLVHRTHDGIAIQPLQPPRADATLVAGAGAGRPCAVGARVDHPDAEAAAAQAREDLEGGADMLTLAFPGGRSAHGYGLPCETLADLDAALDGVRLDLIRLRLDPAPAGRINALMVAALVERRKLSPGQVAVDFSLDSIGTLLSHGHVPWDWATMAARLPETAKALAARGFGGPFVTVDLRPYHEAGASEGQELAAALAQGLLYLRALEAHGLALEEAFRAISFVVPVDADQFMGMAKLRALRLCWAKIAAWCGAASRPAVIHAETSWRMLTKRDPHVNILRNTIAAFAAGAGGADSVTVLPFTQALGLPDAAARRLARNTSIVLQEESNLWRVADPAAGAGGVEALTEALAEKAWALFQGIEGEGGLLVSLALGKLQARIAATRAAREKAIATRKEPITGTSEFAHLGEIAPDVLTVEPVSTKPPKARAKAKFGPDSEAVIAGLLAGASRAATAAEASGELKAEPLPAQRLAEPFEALRDRAEAMATRPRVTLVTLGPLADHAARLQWTRTLFEAGGMEGSVLPSPLEAEGGRLLCLVGSDAAYAAEGAAAARALAATGRTVWLAGRPGELESALSGAGVARFVFAGCDVVETLAAALDVVAA
jgi:methylmalonyl-CoA mutase